ncbi:hypothetical protein ACVXHA_08475 [Escherichia coli]
MPSVAKSCAHDRGDLRHNAKHKPQTFWQGVPVILVHEHHSAIRIQRQSAIVGRFDQYMLPFINIINPGPRCGFLKELLNPSTG